MTILITIIGVLFILAGCIYGAGTLMVLMGYMNDVPRKIKDWNFSDYFAIIAPFALITSGMAILVF